MSSWQMSMLLSEGAHGVLRNRSILAESITHNVMHEGSAVTACRCKYRYHGRVQRDISYIVFWVLDWLTVTTLSVNPCPGRMHQRLMSLEARYKSALRCIGSCHEDHDERGKSLQGLIGDMGNGVDCSIPHTLKVAVEEPTIDRESSTAPERKLLSLNAIDQKMRKEFHHSGHDSSSTNTQRKHTE